MDWRPEGNPRYPHGMLSRQGLAESPQPTTSARSSVSAAEIQARLSALQEQQAQVQAALLRRQAELSSPHLHLAAQPAEPQAAAATIQGAQEPIGPPHGALAEEEMGTAAAATFQGANEPLGPPHEALAEEEMGTAGETRTTLEEP